MVPDKELQKHALAALEFEPGIDARNIAVTTHDGVVTLRGSVPTFYEKRLAEVVIGHVYGVRAIANDVEVLRMDENKRSDTAIAEAAANSLRWDTAIPSDAVRVMLQDGWLTLTGKVEWRYQRDAAEADVRRLHGVKGITNAILVKPRARASDVKTRIERAFRWSAEVDARHVHVQVRGGRVMLTGSVRSLSERQQAERAAWSTPGVKLVDDRIAVIP